MKSKNMILKKLKNIFIFFLVIVLLTTTQLFAVETENNQTSENTENSASLPHIEMRVKSKSIVDSNSERSNQVLVEAWATNISNIVGLEILFTYDGRIIQPSYISGNNENKNIEDLSSIKPTAQQETITQEEQNKLNNKSRELLSNSFEFSQAYKNVLGIDIFKYYETTEENETIQFVLSRKDYSKEIDETSEILIGTFSFRQADGVTIEDSLFSTKRIKVEQDENLKSDEEEKIIYNERDKSKNPDDVCEEIIVFVYEKYGSISGLIDASILQANGKSYTSKNIATIKIYKAEDVQNINWTLDGNKYIAERASLPEPELEYTTFEKDNGAFKIENIKFGKYVILIDKDYWGDFILTDVVIDSANKNINLSEIETIGVIKLIPGDVNKDGIITNQDTIDYNKDLNSTKLVDFNDANGREGKNDTTDTLIYNRALSLYRQKSVKKVISMLGGSYET